MPPPRPQFVLDLDLDVFVHPVAEGKDGHERLNSAEYQIDAHDSIMADFEKMRLSPCAPLTGALFDYHQDSYFHWRELICTGRLRVPFYVIHVDAHSDMGNGASVYPLFEQWGQQADKLAANPYVNSSNYLAFAVTNGWLAALMNMRREGSHGDMLTALFKNFDPETGVLEGKRFVAGEVARTAGAGYAGAQYEPTGETKYAHGKIHELKSFERRPDFVFIARSPSFTPVEIDEYLPHLRSCLLPL